MKTGYVLLMVGFLVGTVQAATIKAANDYVPSCKYSAMGDVEFCAQ